MLGPFSTDSFVPNLPAMESDLKASATLTGLTLQLNWLSFGISMIPVGSMSDSQRFGRRGTIIITMSIYVIGTLGCALAPNVNILILFRIIQGFGEASTVITSAIARDVVTNLNERVRVLAVLGTMRPVAIVLAPTLGGILGAFLGWRAVFFVLATTGFILLLGTILFVPETVPADSRAHFLEGYGIVLSKLFHCGTDAYRTAFGATYLFSVAFGDIFAWIAVVSIILETYYSLSVISTALVISAIPFIIILVNTCIAYLFRSFNSNNKSSKVNTFEKDDSLAHTASIKNDLKYQELNHPEPSSDAHLKKAQNPIIFMHYSLVGIIFAGLTTSVLIFFDAISTVSWLLYVGNFCIFVFAQSAAMGPAQALVMEPFPSQAGVSSSINNLSRSLIGSFISFVSTNSVARFGPMGFLYVLLAVCFLCQLSWIWFSPRRHLNSRSALMPAD